jgi:uncharacterized protein
VIPPPPKAYFNDYAHVVSSGTAQQLNSTLEDYERRTSNQILVVIYPKMQSDSSIEDYTVRVAQKWGAGQKKRDNGAVLFAFIQDRAMFLQVGYGLEGAIPDALAKQIIDTEIVPRFRAGDYDGGMRAGVAAILAAAQGEYKGTGMTVAESKRQQQQSWQGWGILIFFILLIALSSMGRRRGYGYSRYGYGPVMWGGWGGRGWGRGGGGFGGGGGGGFSGGGGSFGGGGAGGRW